MRNLQNKGAPSSATFGMKKETKKTVRVALFIALGVASVGLGACNTVSGVGKDIQEVSDHGKNLLEGRKVNSR